MIDQEIVSLKVWGDLACFTRPEAKVERMTYPVLTPSGARGLLESIFWKPEFHWHVRRITVLNPIRYISIRRNEVQGTVPVGSAHQWMADPAAFRPYLADSAGRDGPQGENRTQRNTLALRDVAYLVEASVAQPRGASSDNPPIKYREMFLRRLAKGQQFQQPYLGIREFAASFSRPSGDERPAEELQAAGTVDLGLMLLDLDYSVEPHRPIFAPAQLERGVLDVDAMRRQASQSREAALC
ncbi:MAG: type I-C CRISPR-associated protein Cas5c [Thermoguttaceae bacterium]